MAPDRLLLHGGHVLSMDPVVGDLERGDVLVEDGRIAAVAPAIEAADAEALDLTGAIVLPGFVDTHRHTWQTALRGVCADWTLLDYFRGIRLTASPAYRPEDVHTGNHAGSLEALGTGVTTILDFSHCMLTPEHAEAALDGLVQSGARAVFAYGYYPVPVAEPAFADHDARLADARRVAGELPSAGGLVTMGVALTELGLVPFEESRSEVASARELDALLTAHTGVITHPDWPGDVELLHEAGLIGPRQVHVHCNACTDRELDLLAAGGAAASITPETELQMGMGRPITSRARASGLQASLGCDIVSNHSGDLFAQMRLALQAQRGSDNERELADGRMPETLGLTAHDVLELATLGGARALGLDGEVGSLVPGKAADVVVLRTDRLGLTPVHNAVATAVLQAGPADVDTVLVAGRLRKRDGVLADVDETRVRHRLEESSQRLLAAVGGRDGLLPAPIPGFTEALVAAALANVGRPRPS